MQQLSRWNNEWLLRKITRAVDKELPDRLIMMIHACHADAIVAAAATFMPTLSLLPPASPLQLLASLPLLTPPPSLLSPPEDPQISWPKHPYG